MIHFERPGLATRPASVAVAFKRSTSKDRPCPPRQSHIQAPWEPPTASRYPIATAKIAAASAIVSALLTPTTL